MILLIPFKRPALRRVVAKVDEGNQYISLSIDSPSGHRFQLGNASPLDLVNRQFIDKLEAKALFILGDPRVAVQTGSLQ